MITPEGGQLKPRRTILAHKSALQVWEWPSQAKTFFFWQWRELCQSFGSFRGALGSGGKGRSAPPPLYAALELGQLADRNL